MNYYLRLYTQLLRINFSLLLAYRANFVGHLIVTTVWTFLLLYTSAIVIGNVRNVFGWDQAGLLLMAGGLTVLMGAFSFFFKKGFQHMPETMLYGELDGILLKPVDSQFLTSMRYIHFTAFLRSIVGFIFIAYIVMHFHMTVTVLSVVSFVLLLMVGLMIYYSIWMFVMTLLIWFPRLSNLIELVTSLNHVSRYPPEVYKEFNFILFLFILPYTLIVTTPIKVVMQTASVVDILVMVLCSAGMVVLSRIFWQFALKFYSSASG